MEYQIFGEIAQHARLNFAAGEHCWATRGALMAYSRGMTWQLRIPGGLGGAVRRAFAGEGIALTYIETTEADQYAMLTSNAPGHLIEWDLVSDGPVVATRGAMLCAWGSAVEIDVTIARRAGAALFGGAGLFLQKLSGDGKVLIHGSGDFVERRLQPGETILVSTGNLAAFSAEVDYDIETVGSLGRMLFGGEGIFMTRLTGPGRVLLQSLKRTVTSSSTSGAGS